MAPLTYVVPATAVYVDAVTGTRYEYRQDAVIPLELAVRLSMPGAALPADVAPFTDAQVAYIGAHGGGGGIATIHNYFPDGAISSNALIDVANDQDYAAKVWYGNLGTETLSRDAVTVGGFGMEAVKVVCPGDAWSEGVGAGDWPGTLGFGSLPAGRYRVGLSVYCADRVNLAVTASAQDGDSTAISLSCPPVIVACNVEGGTQLARIVLDVTTVATGKILLALLTTATQRESGATHDAATFRVGQVMITEGDPWAYRDGASDGWTWSGTAHASASSGPQP